MTCTPYQCYIGAKLKRVKMQSVRDILLHTQNPIDLAQNRAFLYGESLFTTALVKNGNPIFFKEHCERTQKGLEMFFEHSFDKNELEEFLTKFVPKNYDGFFRPTFFHE
jgi:branched-subunit amino acid aminotransferase/4-amino-4-deoxychorismate lyase